MADFDNIEAFLSNLFLEATGDTPGPAQGQLEDLGASLRGEDGQDDSDQVSFGTFLEQAALRSPIPQLGGNVQEVLDFIGVDTSEFGIGPAQGRAERETFANEELARALDRQEVQERKAQQRRDFDEDIRQQVESGNFNFTVRDDEVIPAGDPRSSFAAGPDAVQPTPGGFSKAAPGTASRQLENLDSRVGLFKSSGFSQQEAEQLALSIPRQDTQTSQALAQAKRKQDEGLNLQAVIQSFLESEDPNQRELGQLLALNSISQEELSDNPAIADIIAQLRQRR